LLVSFAAAICSGEMTTVASGSASDSASDGASELVEVSISDSDVTVVSCDSSTSPDPGRSSDESSGALVSSAAVVSSGAPASSGSEGPACSSVALSSATSVVGVGSGFFWDSGSAGASPGGRATVRSPSSPSKSSRS
jgi:hypothetical protein